MLHCKAARQLLLRLTSQRTDHYVELPIYFVKSSCQQPAFLLCIPFCFWFTTKYLSTGFARAVTLGYPGHMHELLQRSLAASSARGATHSCRNVGHFARCPSMRPLAHQRPHERLDRRVNSQLVLPSRLPKSALRHTPARQCCIAQAHSDGGASLPSSQVIAAKPDCCHSQCLQSPDKF